MFLRRSSSFTRVAWGAPMNIRHALSSIAMIAVLSSSFSARAELSQRESSAIYGQDSRQDYYEVTNTDYAAIGVQSTALVMSAYAIDSSDPARLRFRAKTLKAAALLCDGERYAEQLIPAFCSAVLIAPDLMLTAGHCVWDAEGQCPNLRFVFDAYLTTGNQTQPTTVEEEDVYSCQQVITRVQTTSISGTQDWAVVQLDRPVNGERAPATIREARGALSVGAPLLMIGAPNGLPLKWDAGGSVRNPRESRLDSFSATVDAFGGNSGSGVWLRDTQELVGILVSGDTDYNRHGECYRTNICNEAGCSGENVIYIHNVIDDVCDTISHRELCGTAPSCGDGYCDQTESPTSCPADCAAPTCGDGYCARSEWNRCAADCDKVVPESWTCQDWLYGTFDGCQTSCGAKDPDCDLASADGDSLGDLFSCQNASLRGSLPLITSLAAGLLALAIFARRRAARA